MTICAIAIRGRNSSGYAESVLLDAGSPNPPYILLILDVYGNVEIPANTASNPDGIVEIAFQSAPIFVNVMEMIMYKCPNNQCELQWEIYSC